MRSVPWRMRAILALRALVGDPALFEPRPDAADLDALVDRLRAVEVERDAALRRAQRTRSEKETE